MRGRRRVVVAGIALSLRLVDERPQWAPRVATFECRAVAVDVRAAFAIPEWARILGAREARERHLGGQRAVDVALRERVADIRAGLRVLLERQDMAGLARDRARGSLGPNVRLVRPHAARRRDRQARDRSRRRPCRLVLLLAVGVAVAGVAALGGRHVDDAVDMPLAVGEREFPVFVLLHARVAVPAAVARRVWVGRWRAVAAVAPDLRLVHERPFGRVELAAAPAVAPGALAAERLRVVAGGEAVGARQARERDVRGRAQLLGRTVEVAHVALRLGHDVAGRARDRPAERRRREVRRVRADAASRRVDRARAVGWRRAAFTAVAGGTFLRRRGFSEVSAGGQKPHNLTQAGKLAHPSWQPIAPRASARP